MGESALLTWAGLNVRKCSASGDWEGSQPTEGYYKTSPINGPKTYTLKCYSRRGSVEKTITVSVIEPPEAPVPASLPEPPPVSVSLSAAPMEIVSGETTKLSWSSSGADSCSGNAGLGENLPTSGSQTTGALSSDASFTLTCTGPGGSDSRTVMINVLPAPPDSSLKISSSSPTVRAGDSTTLSWSGTSVSNCQASGAWSGPKKATGTETIGPLQTDASFTLSCDGTAGKLVAMTSVLVSEGGKLISWQPPEQNVDGSPLTDLDAYRIYVGLTSGNYGQPIELTDAAISSYFIQLLPGRYYITMTAVDVDGNESSFSNEVLTTVN
jgi:hypothetical protein